MITIWKTCGKTCGSLWQYYRNDPVFNDASAVVNFHVANNSDSFKSKQKIAGKATNANGRKYVEMMMLLKYK